MILSIGDKKEFPLSLFLSTRINLTYHNNFDYVIGDHCLLSKRVFLGASKGQPDFTYVCEDMFKDLDISLLFIYFECEVLTKMNVTPTLLHPNSKSGKVGWVSMTGAHGSLFTLFNSSKKKFKTRFHKIKLNPIYPDRTSLFNKFDGETRRFPFYWQEFCKDINIIMEFPRRMNIKVVLNLPYSGDFMASLEDKRKLVKALNEKNSFMIRKIEIIKGLQNKIIDHEKMVSMKVVENEKLVKEIKSMNMNFYFAVKDLAETKNIVKALND
ncbi:hypothetical protein GmHk_12G035507 [Glycine max]|nr:hypothetical protein GmHk_12G035507 [Glycine max]